MYQEIVSVIIPNYNHEKYLSNRINSVINQTHKKIEVIILDDHSTDNSREVIESFRNHHAIKHIVYNNLNSGSPFKQWEKGIGLAKGKWIWIAESDDYADPTFLETLISAVPKEDSDVSMVYCDSKIVEGNKVQDRTFAYLKNKRFETTKWSENYINEGNDEIENFLLSQATINNTSAVIFKRSKLLQVNPFDLNLRYIGDKYAFIKVLKDAKIVYVNKALNYYRNPFNTKHSDRLIYYFKEQFLVFNYVFKYVDIIDKKQFFKVFYENTSNSLWRNWSIEKITVYKLLIFVNPYLFFKNIVFNFKRSVKSVFNLL